MALFLTAAFLLTAFLSTAAPRFLCSTSRALPLRSERHAAPVQPGFLQAPRALQLPLPACRVLRSPDFCAADTARAPLFAPAPGRDLGGQVCGARSFGP